MLTLEVLAPHDGLLGAARLKVFHSGGTIGRDKNSDWILPHGKVSARHAQISCENDTFYIEDSSRNGTCLNSSSNRLTPGLRHPLNSGDRILIGPYEIRVTMAGEADERRWRPAPASGLAADPRSSPGDLFDVDDPFGQPVVPSPHAGYPPPASSQPSPVEAMSGEELDPLVLLGAAPPRRAPSPKPRDVEPLASHSPLNSHFTPPAVASAAPPSPGAESLIPSDYDFLAPDDLQRPPPAAPAAKSVAASSSTPRAEGHSPKPSRVVAAASAGARQRDLVVEAAAPLPPVASAPREHAPGDLSAVLAGAGLGGVEVTAELARSFGQILRLVVAGVMDVLRARQQIKDEFRMPVTRVRPVDNNPLKLSANVDDALHNLLVKRNAAFLGPVEAFDDAFDDLRDHQMALLAGMRTAYESMLAQFDPDRLQQTFDRQLKKGGFLAIPAKLRYWELYRERYEEAIKDPELSFRKLFGEEFARAYEEQLTRLKADKAGGKGST
jgi:type VI secretion system FHA domain protein